ncbi:hypothetical protein V3C33_06695 [Micrococcaceae bacterium Sec5.7]
MTRPDSGSPDQSANEDDAVWLDLVARLEADTPGMGNAGVDPAVAGDTPEAAVTAEPAEADGAGAARFRDFDPLGLSASVPTEPSAAERQAAAASTPAAADPSPVLPGPRDYGVDDDAGGFVPEEPPSLSGTDPLTMLAWLGAVGGPIALLLSAMFWRSAPLMAILGIVAAFVVAVVYLIMKLPQEKDENDDGARV